MVENAKISFSISLYCTLLFSRKENLKYFKVALATVLRNGEVACIMIVWGYRHWNTIETKLKYIDIQVHYKDWLLSS